MLVRGWVGWFKGGRGKTKDFIMTRKRQIQDPIMPSALVFRLDGWAEGKGKGEGLRVGGGPSQGGECAFRPLVK